MESIAEDAGYSKGAVYARFGGKDDLFLAVLEARFEQRLPPIGVDAARYPTREGRIEAVARAHREMVAADPAWTVAWVEFAAHATRDADLSRRLRALNTKLRERAERRLIELGLVDAAEAGYLATISLVYASGVSVERMLDPEGSPDTHLARMARALAVDVTEEESDG